MLADALLCAAGEAPPPAELRALAARARTCPVPSVGLQALALLTGAGTRPDLGTDELMAMAATVPRACWSIRLDVLSIDEALHRLSALAHAG